MLQSWKRLPAFYREGGGGSGGGSASAGSKSGGGGSKYGSDVRVDTRAAGRNIRSGEGKGMGAKTGESLLSGGKQAQSIASAQQNISQSSVSAPARSTAPIAAASTPVLSTSGTSPSGSAVIGFPSNGYAGPDAANLDLIELAELLQMGADRGFPDIDGDMGADYTDDALTFGGIVAKAKMPLIAIAAFLGLGFLAWKAAT